MYSDADRAHMGRALALAQQGPVHHHAQPARRLRHRASDGQVVGEGWHRQTGEPHAEILALAQAGGKARGATVYVTLEPCSHQGRTPPCTDMLIEARCRAGHHRDGGSQSAGERPGPRAAARCRHRRALRSDGAGGGRTQRRLRLAHDAAAGPGRGSRSRRRSTASPPCPTGAASGSRRTQPAPTATAGAPGPAPS